MRKEALGGSTNLRAYDRIQLQNKLNPLMVILVGMKEEICERFYGLSES